MTTTYLDELRASIPPSVLAILSDPALPAWERELRHRLKQSQRRLVELRQRRAEYFSPWWFARVRLDALNACQWQRDLIADIKRFDEGD